MSQFQISLVVVIMLNLAPVQASPLSLIGCFEDSSNRVLNGKTTKLNPNGNEQCNQYCQGYLYFGTESGDECFCGDEIRFHKKTAPCTDICRGNPGEYCGGHLHIMIYGTHSHENTSTPSSRQISVSGHHVAEKSRSTNQKPSTNHDTLSTLKPVRKTDKVEASLDRLIGCYKDYNNRVLNGNSAKLDPNGRKECKQFCQGFRYFGTESGEDCFCGNKIRYRKKTAHCTYKCRGNPDEYCGGDWKIMIYVTKSYENTSTTSSTEISASTHHVTETSKSTSPQSSVNHVTETNKSNSPQLSVNRVTEIGKSTSQQSSVNPMIETSKGTSQKPATNHDTLSTLKPVRKTNTGDDKTSVSYLYVLLPVGIIVIAVILVIIICKRRLFCKKDSGPVASNSVVYAAPYRTAYLTPVHEPNLSIQVN